MSHSNKAKMWAGLESLKLKATEEAVSAETSVQDENQHYKPDFMGVIIDPYRLARIYKDSNWTEEQFHAIKKLMRAGKSTKSLMQDLSEVKCTIDRWIEILKEDELINQSEAQPAAQSAAETVALTDPVTLANRAYKRNHTLGTHF